MLKIMPVGISGCLMFALLICLYSPSFGADTLNPEGINPHANNPRKRITQEQKQAAADAMKKRKAEIEARKAAESAKKAPAPIQNLQPGVSEDGHDKVNK